MNTIFLASYIVLWVVVIALTIAIFALYHHFGQMYLVSPEHRAAQGPPLDDWLKGLEVESITGAPVILPLNSPSIVLFMSTTCNICSGLRQELVRLVESRLDVSVSVICGGEEKMVQAWAEGIADLVPVIADPGGRIAARYNVDLLPFYTAVGADGIIRGKGLAGSYEALEFACQEAVGGLPVINKDSHLTNAHQH